MLLNEMLNATAPDNADRVGVSNALALVGKVRAVCALWVAVLL
jgi:hypothetical protein